MNIVGWTKTDCVYCQLAKGALEDHGIKYKEKIIGVTVNKQDLLNILPEAKTVPQIFVDGKAIGGYNELMQSSIIKKENYHLAFGNLKPLKHKKLYKEMKKQIVRHDKRVMLYLKNQDWLKIRKQKDKRRRRVLEKLWLIRIRLKAPHMSRE